ncbi:hypothetical protein TSAR_006237 [Trichomalopsis sarcophagae]|uniref:Uncharacterized protein n=1 Tax=Trichomalopsis sarcophagae TaxID=543379 RepID=A0A232F869_9HYME|nr:hypothetical protein TSAR_006237 [Trichomalopsis sarcophagae]
MRWRPWRDDRASALQARESRFKPGVRHFFVALFTRNKITLYSRSPNYSHSLTNQRRRTIQSVSQYTN